MAASKLWLCCIAMQHTNWQQGRGSPALRNASQLHREMSSRRVAPQPGMRRRLAVLQSGKRARSTRDTWPQVTRPAKSVMEAVVPLVVLTTPSRSRPVSSPTSSVTMFWIGRPAGEPEGG